MTDEYNVRPQRPPRAEAKTPRYHWVKSAALCPECRSTLSLLLETDSTAVLSASCTACEWARVFVDFPSDPHLCRDYLAIPPAPKRTAPTYDEFVRDAPPDVLDH